MKSAWTVILLLTTNLGYSCGENENRIGLVVRLENQLRKYQKAAMENFEHINETFSYTGDTPRVYDNRLPYILLPMPIREQKYKKGLIPITLKEYPKVFRLLTGRLNEQYRIGKKYKKFQEKIPDWVPFPCKLVGTRSKTKPTSVHKLRPGDIDVVVNFGDSISVGNMVAGTSLTNAFTENRGISAFGGGQGTWRKFLTLPNILKVFNSNLYGYGTDDVYYNEVTRKAIQQRSYNWAVAGSIVDDLPVMLQSAIAQLKRDPKVNFEQDWKMYTILVGGIDLCHDVCYWKRPSEAVNHMKHTIHRSMTYLYENSPRTLVNFIPMLNTVTYSKDMEGLAPVCKHMRPSVCSCAEAQTFRNVSDQMSLFMDQLVEAQEEGTKDPKFQEKEDFAIVVQPTLRNLTIPKINTPKGISTDFRLLAPDCFHVSQVGHAILAKGLWNNLMAPAGEKEAPLNFERDLLKNIVCPTERNPYIPTQSGSVLKFNWH